MSTNMTHGFQFCAFYTVPVCTYAMRIYAWTHEYGCIFKHACRAMHMHRRPCMHFSQQNETSVCHKMRELLDICGHVLPQILPAGNLKTILEILVTRGITRRQFYFYRFKHPVHRPTVNLIKKIAFSGGLEIIQILPQSPNQYTKGVKFLGLSRGGVRFCSVPPNWAVDLQSLRREFWAALERPWFALL